MNTRMKKTEKDHPRQRKCSKKQMHTALARRLATPRRAPEHVDGDHVQATAAHAHKLLLPLTLRHPADVDLAGHREPPSQRRPRLVRAQQRLRIRAHRAQCDVGAGGEWQRLHRGARAQADAERAIDRRRRARRGRRWGRRLAAASAADHAGDGPALVGFQRLRPGPAAGIGPGRQAGGGVVEVVQRARRAPAAERGAPGLVGNGVAHGPRRVGREAPTLQAVEWRREHGREVVAGRRRCRRVCCAETHGSGGRDGSRSSGRHRKKHRVEVKAPRRAKAAAQQPTRRWPGEGRTDKFQSSNKLRRGPPWLKCSFVQARN
jgi:hypothetical protein